MAYDGRTSLERDYDTSGCHLGDDDFRLDVRLNGTLFAIDVSPENCHNFPVATDDSHTYFDLLLAGREDVDGVWDYLEKVFTPFLPQVRALAPPVVHSGKLTLAYFSPRGFFECKLNVINEKPNPDAITPVAYEEYEEDFEIRTLDSPFPVFRSSEIELEYENPDAVFEIIPREVVVHGQPLFYKSSYSIDGPREKINKHCKIVTSGLPPDELRTERLYGTVGNSKGRIVGLLYHRIITRETLTWAIKNTRMKLHELAVVWGDVKAENVLIDEQGNAVIIDLEDGMTQGWVDREKADTVKGELQGVESMMDYIFNDNSVLRPPLECGDDDFEMDLKSD